MAAEKRKPWWKESPAAAPDPVVAPAAAPAPAPALANPNDIADGDSREVQGSGSKPYILKNIGGVYSCSCPAWMNQGVAIERRTCKHLKSIRGVTVEEERVGAVSAGGPARTITTLDRGDGVAPGLLLAHKWEHDVDLTGWWMSEKLDGVRAYWDGTRLISRQGNTFYAPDWFLEALPRDMHLDGELFGGRKNFQRTVSAVRRQDRNDAAWREIQYLIFDAPQHAGAFEDRLAAVDTLLATRAVAHVVAHPHEVCRGIDHVREALARVEGLGGEGLMMRKPASRYESGRSHTLLKVKTFHDAEAVVVAHLPGAGKHKGRLGALECDLPDGTRFSVGTGFSDAERASPPPVGTTITFRYQELTTDGVPRFPSYVRVRTDVSPLSPSSPSPSSPSPSPGPRAVPAVPPSRTAAAAAPPRAVAPAPLTEATRDARVFVKEGATWQITLSGKQHATKSVRGEAIETVTRAFSGGALAWRDASALIAARLADGWTEVDPD